jgi:hypothetical protein
MTMRSGVEFSTLGNMVLKRFLILEHFGFWIRDVTFDFFLQGFIVFIVQVFHLFWLSLYLIKYFFFFFFLRLL